MHKPASIRENEKHTILQIQTDHQISARKPELVVITDHNKIKRKWNDL